MGCQSEERSRGEQEHVAQLPLQRGRAIRRQQQLVWSADGPEHDPCKLVGVGQFAAEAERSPPEFDDAGKFGVKLAIAGALIEELGGPRGREPLGKRIRALVHSDSHRSPCWPCCSQLHGHAGLDVTECRAGPVIGGRDPEAIREVRRALNDCAVSGASGSAGIEVNPLHAKLLAEDVPKQLISASRATPSLLVAVGSTGMALVGSTSKPYRALPERGPVGERLLCERERRRLVRRNRREPCARSRSPAPCRTRVKKVAAWPARQRCPA